MKLLVLRMGHKIPPPQSRLATIMRVLASSTGSRNSGNLHGTSRGYRACSYRARYPVQYDLLDCDRQPAHQFTFNTPGLQLIAAGLSGPVRPDYAGDRSARWRCRTKQQRTHLQSASARQRNGAQTTAAGQAGWHRRPTFLLSSRSTKIFAFAALISGVSSTARSWKVYTAVPA